MIELKRKIYKRGSSYEVTIPSSLLFELDLSKKNSVNFVKKNGKWCIELKNEKQ